MKDEGSSQLNVIWWECSGDAFSALAIFVVNVLSGRVSRPSKSATHGEKHIKTLSPARKKQVHYHTIGIINLHTYVTDRRQCAVQAEQPAATRPTIMLHASPGRRFYHERIRFLAILRHDIALATFEPSSCT